MNVRRQMRSKWRSLYIWHRTIGLIIAIPVLVLAITGMLLNHTEDFQLNEHYVGNPLILWLYQLPMPENIISFPLGEQQISQVGEQLYVGSQPLTQSAQPLVGAVQLPQFKVIALGQSLILLTPKGELMEQLDRSTGVPAPIKSVGLLDTQQLLVKTPEAIFQTDPNMLEWNIVSPESVDWARPSPAPKLLQQHLLADARGRIITSERMILDLHTGRLFGPAGVLIVDLAAIILIALACTGFWIWIKQRHKHPKPKENKIA